MCAGGPGARFARAVNVRHEALVDAAVPVLVGAVILVGEGLHGGHGTRPESVALGLAAAASLWARWRAPAWTLAVSGALVVLLLHVDGSGATVAVLAPAVALYSLALRRGRRAQLLAGLAAVAAVLVADLLHTGRPGVLQTLGHTLLVALPLLAAEAIRTHRSYLEALREQLALSEHAREQEAERRVAQERMRIARELHDVVAHTLTEINLQAAAGAERASAGDARVALERIEDRSHSAIGELRAILGVLREPVQSDAPRAPAPGIDNIAELVDSARTSGVDARLTVAGPKPGRVSDTTSLAAYRIVQESLTNARRHAPGAAVRVNLTFDPGELSLVVASGPGSGSTGNGAVHGIGIAGMRERAGSIGGNFSAGATDLGFVVQARLPYLPLR
jgi:signal transduction histidine kinase